jgi:hypothetical protein
MAFGLVKDNGSVFIEKEVTEGVYVAEASGAAAVEVLSDGLEFTPTKELLERNNRTSTVETVVSRVGQKSMTGTVPSEFKASAVEGAEPETGILYEALLGGKDSLVEVTSLTGHTTTKIFLDAGDELQYKAGHIVKIKQSEIAGVDHVSPIVAVDSSLGVESITLLVPYSVAFSNGVKIAASTVYFHQSGQPTLSITNYLGGEIREKAIGMRPVSAELSNFSTGQLPEFNFSIEGLDFAREVGQPLFAPVYDSEAGAEPPVVLCSKVYKDGVEIVLNSLTLSINNTIGFLTSTASCSGKISSRITKMTCGFTINPYMEDDDVDLFSLFEANTGFSIFGSSNNYGASTDELEQVVAFYMPNCRIPEITTGDEDGILTDAINGTAHRLLGNDTVFIAFI